MEQGINHEDSVPMTANLALHWVYGNWIHDNPGAHLCGGVTTDELWQQ